MRILLPVDGSEYSKTAIKFLAARQAGLGEDLKVELLNVQNLVPQAIIERLNLTAVDAYSEAEAKKVFVLLEEAITQNGLIAEKKVLTGDIGDTIVAEAKDSNTDLIVMGTHGRSGLSSLLLGSVSIRVLSKIRCPLLLVREKTPVLKDRLRIAVCVDDDRHALAGATLIANNLKFFGKDPVIKVIHVITDENKAETAVNGVMDIFAKAGVPAEFVQLKGNASQEIADYTEGNCDLVVMGSHGLGNFRSAVLGSTASRIAANSALPILIVKA